MLRSRVLLLSSLLVLALFAGCSDSTAPAPDDKDNILDPGDGSFALKDLAVQIPWGPPVLLRLEGSNMVADPAEGTVSLDVHVRNLSDRTIGVPLTVWLSGFTPADVAPANADLVMYPEDDPVHPNGVVDSTGVWVQWGYDYAGLIGDDGLLAPGEASAPKTWIFEDPSLGSFAFAARADIGDDPGQARLGGMCFLDLDYNGLPGEGEPPFNGGSVIVTGPGDYWHVMSPGDDGRYAAPLWEPGIYQVTFESYSMTPLPVEFTTPNPLTVVITAGPDGVAQSFLDAHFGIAPGWFPPPFARPIGFTDLRPEALHVAPWMYLDASVDGALMTFHVGYSGCSPEHPFSLWMSGGFMESQPPRAVVTLVNELDEECDAYFEQMPVFDLSPLFHRYMESYGPGELILDLRGPDGFSQLMKIGIAMPDSSDPGYPGGS
ncbi:MAG: hypothetical protein Q7W56_07740 [Candidatus Latescibacteria bacterium]|nr:hypothetical protein [Candidatus Latescibacterota bacterium]